MTTQPHTRNTTSLTDEAARRPGPKALAWIMTKPEPRRTALEAAVRVRVLQDVWAASVPARIWRLVAIIRDSNFGRPHPAQDAAARLTGFDTRLAAAAASGLSAIQTFVAGRADGDAVRAALTTPGSNAQVEGSIARHETIKRRSCGRAGFGLLRRRILSSPPDPHKVTKIPKRELQFKSTLGRGKAMSVGGA